jgi:hypothetical protein
MTTEHLSQTQLLGYGARTLNSEELLAVDRHLASCDMCHDRLAAMLSEVSERPYDLSIDEEPFHLDYDQHLVPYVDGVANEIDREIIESHIALCTQCADDVRDLQVFRQQPALQTPRPLKESRWRMNPWRLLQPRFAVALIIAIFGLGVTTAVWFWSRKSSPLPVHRVGPVATPEIYKPTPEPSPGRVATLPSPAPSGDINMSREAPLIALNDGGRQITLDKNGRSTGLESLPSDLRTTVEKVLAARKFGRSPAFGFENLAESNGRLRGGSEPQDTIVQLSPAGVVLETDRPVFHWKAFEGASEYVITVHNSKLRQVENSGPVTGTSWSISKPLARGDTYSWQIRAVIDGRTVISPKPPAPETRFRVLGEKGMAAIETAKRTQATSHLTMAVLYWRHGLIEAAERELEALLRANPGSTVATELLRSLRSPRRP